MLTIKRSEEIHITQRMKTFVNIATLIRSVKIELKTPNYTLVFVKISSTLLVCKNGFKIKSLQKIMSTLPLINGLS